MITTLCYLRISVGEKAKIMYTVFITDDNIKNELLEEKKQMFFDLFDELTSKYNMKIVVKEIVTTEVVEPA